MTDKITLELTLDDKQPTPMNRISTKISSIVHKVLNKIRTFNLSYEEKIYLAKNPNTSQELLQILATDKDWGVRYRVSDNPNTSQELLQVLATDEDVHVRWEARENPNMPQEILEDYYVLDMLAHYPNIPEESMRKVIRERLKEKKQGVVSSTKSKTLTDLIYRWWSDVFTTHSDWDMETSIEDLVDQIELWLPKQQSAAGSQNAYVECSVEGFNDCLTKIKGKLR